MNTDDNHHNLTAPAGKANMGLAITSLVLGLLGFILSLFLVGAVLGVLGIVFGALHLRQRERPRAMAWWGVGLSCLALLASVALGVTYYRFYQEFREMMADFEDGGADLASWEGVVAPDLVIKTVDGEELRLDDLRGRRVVLNFWATWCGPCVKEIPHLIQLADETPSRELLIIGISDEDTSTVRAFINGHGVNYPMGQAVEDDLASPYNDVRAIPTTFFIDRNGVIQTVLQGYQDLDTLRTFSLADDYEGDPKPAPEAPVSGLQEAKVSFKPISRWVMESAAVTVASGDWDGDGRDDLLVVDPGRKLRVFAEDGTEKTGVSLPGDFTHIELGRHRKEALRLLGHTNWGRQVVAMNGAGKTLWSYRSGMGVNGAHWGDLTGDGTDEMIVGMNGSGGLHAVSADGEQLWRAGGIGNVWNQAIIPAVSGQPAMIFATEAGGSVRVFDADGNPIRTLRPLDEYFSQMSAARVHPSGAIQIVAQGDVTAGFDEEGHVAWSTPAIRDHGAWRRGSFASGDLTGDGLPEWVFLDVDRTLAVVLPGGEKLASVPEKGELEAFCVLSRPDGEGLLVTLVDGKIEAYGFEPASEVSVASD